MKSWLAKLAILPLGLLLLPSCTARYQQMLLNKDLQIRDLQARIAELTATNADLEAREKGWRAKADLAAKPAPAASSNADRIQKEVGGDAQVRYRNGRLSIGIDNVVTFASGSTKLKQNAGQVLRKVSRVLNREFANRRIYIEGHTDRDPIRKTKKLYRSNRHLSAERADAVASYLTSKCGIPDSHVVVVGYGPHDPVAKGGGRSTKARNRRVEIVVGEEL